MAAVGHLVFAVGAGVEKPTLLMLGRMLSGMSYEVIDIMTIPLTSPYFQVPPAVDACSLSPQLHASLRAETGRPPSLRTAMLPAVPSGLTDAMCRRCILLLCPRDIAAAADPCSTTPQQDGTWGILSGCVNGFIRLGSVVQFVLMPVVYRRYGIVAALWTASAMGSSGLILGVLSQRIAGILRRAQARHCPHPPSSLDGAPSGFGFWLSLRISLTSLIPSGFIQAQQSSLVHSGGAGRGQQEGRANECDGGIL